MVDPCMIDAGIDGESQVSLTLSILINTLEIDFADAKSISCMDYEILQKIKRHRNQRIYRVFCGCFFEFQKIATTTLWKTNFVCMFHTRDALARLSYVAVHRSA